MEVNDADVAELARSSRERLQQLRRRCRAAMNEDLLAGADAGNCLIRADDSHASSVGCAGCRVACHSVPTISPFSPDRYALLVPRSERHDPAAGPWTLRRDSTRAPLRCDRAR